MQKVFLSCGVSAIGDQLLNRYIMEVKEKRMDIIHAKELDCPSAKHLWKQKKLGEPG